MAKATATRIAKAIERPARVDLASETPVSASTATKGLDATDRPARVVLASETLVTASTATSTARATVRPARVVRASETPDINLTAASDAKATDRPIRDVLISRTPFIAATSTATAAFTQVPVATIVETPIESVMKATQPGVRILQPTIHVILGQPDDVTATAADESATHAETPSPTVPSTATPLPFVDSALVPTPTPYGESGADLREVCVLATDWHEYEVGESDNLLNIAVRVGSSIVEIREGNCYEPLRGIFAGESLLVPSLPLPQQEAAAPVFPDDGEEITAIGCESPSVQITSPQPLQEISGIFELYGNLDLGEASHYQVEVRPAWSDKYWLYIKAAQPVNDSVITLINSEVFGIGLHHVRLSLIDDNDLSQARLSCDIPIVFLQP